MIVPGPDNRAYRLIRGMMYIWIAVLVLALDPRTADPAAPVKYLASAIAASAMMLVWAFAVRTDRAPYRRMSPAQWFQFLFFGALVLSALVSGTRDRSLAALCPWIIFSAIGFVAYQTFPHANHLRNLFRAIVVSVALSSVYGLAQHFGWDPFPWAERNVEEYRALPATYGNPNFAGHALVIALAFWAGLVTDAWQRKGWCVDIALYLVPGALMLTHLVLTHMRGGPVALSVSLLFIVAFLTAQRFGRNRIDGALISLGVCVAVLGTATIAALLLAPRLGLDSSLQLRLHGYAGAAALFLENPILGVGPGNYAFHNIPHWSEFEGLWYALEGKRNFHVHNEWLEMAAECGVLGVATFIGLFVFAIATFFHNPWLSAEKHWGLFLAIPAAVVVVATDACFGFNLHAPVSAGLFFLLVMLRPARPYYGAPARKSSRRGMVPLCLLTLAAAWVLCADYGHERRFQRAQGAVAWEREGRASGVTMDHAEQASDLLEALTKERPGDYRGWMLRGDFALEQGQAALAVDAYGQALSIHPHLPRLHVQKARAHIRAAQESGSQADLDAANRHADISAERCPQLADAHAMLGWAAYVTTTLPARDPSDDDVKIAIEHFTRARALGLSGDAGIDAALGELHGRLQDWPAAADALKRAVRLNPSAPQSWLLWHDAATRAGGSVLDTHQQTLLHHLGNFTSGSGEISPELATWIGGRIATLAESPAQVTVAVRALRDALSTAPSLSGIWGAWLGLIDEGNRKEALAEAIATIPDSKRVSISPVISAIHAALAEPHPDTLASASNTLLQSLSTAPGAENFTLASIHAPLLNMLDQARRDSGHPDTSVGLFLRDLGAARFEIGDLDAADTMLRMAESVLPADALSKAWYYHSRTLAALGQHDAALSMAKAALDADSGTVEHSWQTARCLASAGHGEAARFAYESLLGSLPPNHTYRPRIDVEFQAIPTTEGAP
jgi:O-antigen ligase/tetratricopeptide (TPR) repeat protein